MDGISLKQLRYFDAVAREEHFGRAAAASSISQPAISVQIKELEETLGVALFERGARQVRITPAGTALIERARAILASVDALYETARASAGQGLTRLRLGIIPTIAPYLLPKIIGALNEAFPGIDLQVRETLTPRLIEELSDARLDAAILALPLSAKNFTEVPIFTEEFVLVRPKADAGKPVPDGEALRRMRLLLLEEGHCFRDQALAFCSLAPAVPRDGLDGSSLTTLVQMVSAGIGVTLIPEMAIPVEAPSAQIDIARFPPQGAPKRHIGMVWRKSSATEEQLLRVADVVHAACTEHLAQ